MYMNRKQVLKSVKNKKKDQVVNEDTNYFNRFVGILAGSIIILIIGYLLIGIFITKSITFKKTEETKEEVSIDNDTILAGQLFDQKDDKYFVIIYNKNEKESILKDWVTYYNQKEDKLKLYVIDSEEKLNSNYIVEKESNKNPDSYEDLKIISPSLIKVEDGKVTEYYEGVNEVKEKLKGE